MEEDDDATRWPRGFGRALADLFRELGYDEGELHADMFEGLFGLPSLRVQAFLDWFLSSIRARQSVRRQLGGDADYAVYKTLLARNGGVMLTGEQLARAEAACQLDRAGQTRGGGGESLDALERTNAALEREVAAMETKLRLANDRNERLARLAQRRGATVDQQTQRLQRQHDREQFSEILAQTVPTNRRGRIEKVPTPKEVEGLIQATLRHLATPAPAATDNVLATSSQHRSSSASSLVSTSSSGMVSSAVPISSALSLDGHARKWKDFLYQHSMEPLQVQEESNLRALQARIPAISALTSASSIQSSGDTSHEPNGSSDVSMSPAPPPQRRDQDGPHPSPWLHESDPTQLNMRDQDTLLYNKCCVELERLRKAFVVGEQDALLAQLQVTRYESQLRQLTSSRRQLLQQFQLMSRDGIWARKQILLATVEKTKKQLGELFQRELPEKLDELAFLKSTSVLLHSYEQKLWRQENRFVKLRLLLEGFEMQQARLRLVHRLLDAERQDLLQIDSIFQQLLAAVREENQRSKQRIDTYDTTTGSDAARNTLAQTYLHEQDDVAQQLFEMLERRVHHGNHQQLAKPSFGLRTFDDLVRLGELKCSNEKGLHEATGRLHDELKRLYDSKRFTLDQLRREMFGDATSSTPMLLPVELDSALRQANDTKDAAEIRLEKALETLRLHRRSDQVDPARRMQQEQDIARLQRELQEQQ